MFLELAIADAYGAGMEYVDPSITKKYNNLKSMIKHPTHGLHAGQYTDDTQMTLGLVEFLINAEKLDVKPLVGSWINAFQRDKRLGYARRFQEFLETHADVESFIRDIKPDSNKSGGAMRVTPVGLIPDLAWVKRVADWQARITHNTTEGAEAAVAAALLVYYCAFDIGDLDDVGKWIQNEINGVVDWTVDWSGKVGAEGWKSTQAAITAVRYGSSTSGILKTCVAFTGDVDTVATIAIGAASNSDQIRNDLPPHLKFQLEVKGQYGRTYLVELEKKYREWIAADGWKKL